MEAQNLGYKACFQMLQGNVCPFIFQRLRLGRVSPFKYLHFAVIAEESLVVLFIHPSKISDFSQTCFLVPLKASCYSKTLAVQVVLVCKLNMYNKPFQTPTFIRLIWPCSRFLEPTLLRWTMTPST